jgi:hypothetical protein
MNGAPASWSRRAVRGWTQLYTAGAHSAARDARRAQIDSDLWEHAADAQALGRTSRGLAFEVAGRMVRGIPADIAWRLGSGGFEMRSMLVIERGTGLVMLLVSFLIVGAMGGPGISGSEPYFTDDFPAFANDLGSVLRAVIFRFAVGAAMIPAAGLLYLTFRPYSTAIAAFGAMALVVTSVLFVVGAVVTLELHALAGDWREARAAAGRVETMGAFAIMGLGLSFAGFGVIIARNAVLPRPIAWLALAGGAVLLGSLPLWSFGDWAWYVFISGTLSVTISFLLTAGWLTIRGTRRTAMPATPANQP